mgnify:CR=1 FL=1
MSRFLWTRGLWLIVVEHTLFLFGATMPLKASYDLPTRLTAGLAGLPMIVLFGSLAAHLVFLVFENLLTSRLGTPSPSYAMISDRMPPQVRRWRRDAPPYWRLDAAAAPG